MSFIDSIKAGIDKANQANANISKVRSLFMQINAELKTLSPKNISLNPTASTSAQVRKVAQSLEDPLKPKEYLDQDQLCLIVDSKSGTPVAKWRQNVNGLPCSIAFDGDEFLCYSVEELTEALNMLLSSTNFGTSLKKIMDA